MGFRTGRYIEPELLDDQPPDEAAPSLQDLVRINRMLGGHQVLRDALRQCFRPNDAFNMLDVGAAGGDAAAIVTQEYRRARIVSADYRVSHLNPLAETCVAGDAFQLPFRARSFDIVYCGLFLHHFDNQQITQLLRTFGELSRNYVVANDLERHILPWLFLPATKWLFGWNRLTVHDGPISVQAAFTAKELERLARDAGLRSPVVQVYRPSFRLCLLAKVPL